MSFDQLLAFIRSIKELLKTIGIGGAGLLAVVSLAILSIYFLREEKVLYGYFRESDCNSASRINEEKMTFNSVKFLGILGGTSSWKECGQDPNNSVVNRYGPYIGLESEQIYAIAYKSETIDQGKPKDYGIGVIVVMKNRDEFAGYTVQYNPYKKVFEECPYVISTEQQIFDQDFLRNKYPHLRDNHCKPISMNNEHSSAPGSRGKP